MMSWRARRRIVYAGDRFKGGLYVIEMNI